MSENTPRYAARPTPPPLFFTMEYVNEIYRDGARACARGLGLEACHFLLGSTEWLAWVDGWFDESYAEARR